MLEQAQELLDSGRLVEAERLYRKALKEDRSNTQAVFMLALVRQQRGARDEALELMERAARQDSENAHIHYTLGSMQIAQRKVEDARHSYLQAIQFDPFNADAHNGLAFTELAAANYVAAENAANMALAEEPKNPQSLVYMGTAKLEQGELTNAISYFQEALKEAPNHQAAKLLLGRAFLEAGNHAFASQSFQTILEENPAVPQAWEYLGQAEEAQGRFKSAAHAYQQAVECGSRKPSLIRALAEAHRSAGNEELAEEILNAQANPQGENPAIDFSRADAALATGKPLEALNLLSRYGGYQADMMKAAALEQMRDYASAIELVEAHLDSDEMTDESMLAYARVLAKVGRSDEADAIIDSLLAKEHPPLGAKLFRGFQLCREGSQAGIEILQEIERVEEIEDVERRRVRRILANTLDGLDRFEEAASYYELNAGRLAQISVVAEAGSVDNREMLDEKGMPMFQRREATGELPADPVFFLTWPGSGWEWLMSALSAHPGVMPVVDKPETQLSRRLLLAKPEGREALTTFTPRDANDAAAQYWQHLAGGKLSPGTRQTVDSLWLSSDSLPTISAIFPTARIVVINRDPAEMVLDWFRAGYAELPAMAERFREQQKLLTMYRDKVPLEFIDVSGDQLIEEPRVVVEQVLGQLGLEWRDEIGQRLDDLAGNMAAYHGKARDYEDILESPLGILGAASRD